VNDVISHQSIARVSGLDELVLLGLVRCSGHSRNLLIVINLYILGEISYQLSSILVGYLLPFSCVPALLSCALHLTHPLLLRGCDIELLNVDLITGMRLLKRLASLLEMRSICL